jgi:hypothetical protein
MRSSAVDVLAHLWPGIRTDDYVLWRSGGEFAAVAVLQCSAAQCLGEFTQPLGYVLQNHYDEPFSWLTFNIE